MLGGDFVSSVPNPFSPRASRSRSLKVVVVVLLLLLLLVLETLYKN